MGTYLKRQCQDWRWLIIIGEAVATTVAVVSMFFRNEPWLLSLAGIIGAGALLVYILLARGQPVILEFMTQAEYEALPKKDKDTVYFTRE